MTTPDLFGGARTADVTLAQQIETVERELRMREQVYPRRIEAGRMTREQADRELLCMRAVLDTLRRLAAA